jgi:Helix-turn-helix domain
MSVRVMADVWDNGPSDPTECAVLLYLANRSDDEGKNCFPSRALIAQKTRYSQRTVQRALISLEKGDWLSVFRGSGRGVISSYEVNISKLKGRHAVSERKTANEVKRETLTPRKGDTDAKKGRHSVQKKETMTTIPQTPYKEETSLSISRTPEETPAELFLVPNEPDFPDWLPVSLWNDYIAMRRKIKKPMTEEAKKLAIAKLEKLRKAGHAPNLVLEESIMNSWQGLFELKPSRQIPIQQEKPKKVYVTGDPKNPADWLAAQVPVENDL